MVAARICAHCECSFPFSAAGGIFVGKDFLHSGGEVSIANASAGNRGGALCWELRGRPSGLEVERVYEPRG